MTRIRFLTPVAGANFSHRYHEVVDYKDDAEARRYIASGQAELVRDVAPQIADAQRGAERTVRVAGQPPARGAQGPQGPQGRMQALTPAGAQSAQAAAAGGAQAGGAKGSGGKGNGGRGAK